MVSVKKLVTAFLLLAAVTSSSALIFFDLGAPSQTKENGAGTGAATAGDSSDQLSIGGNAYVEPLPSNSALTVAAPTDTAADVASDFTKSKNLTESLANTLAKQFTDLNPSGPTNESGEAGLVAPDPNAIVAQLSSNPELANALAQDWEAKLLVPSFKILRNYTPDDLIAYGKAFNDIFEKNFVESGVQDLIAANVDQPSTDVLSSVKTIFDQTSLDGAKVAVPAPAENFHRTFLKLASFEKNQITLAEDQNDPLKSALTLQAQQGKENELLLNLSSEFQKIQKIVFLPGSNNAGSFISLMNSLVGVREAHAQWIVHDIVTNIANIIRDIAHIVKTIIVETLKNYLIKQFVNQTIDWIKNGGTPRYITNWKDVVTGAAKDVAAETIYKIAPGICSAFSPIIIQRFRSSYNTSVQKAAGSCTLEQIVSNVKRFYTDFSEGKWVGYGTTLLPSGNFFGSLFANSQIAQFKASAAAVNEASQGQAANGFLGTKVCSKVEVQYVPKIECSAFGECGDPGPWTEDNARAAATAIGYNYLGGFTAGSGAFNACSKGNYQITTPGGSVAHAIDNALPAPLHKIVNSNDIVGLISVLIDSAITKLTAGGDQGIKYTTPTVALTTTVTPPPTTQEGVLDEANNLLSDKNAIINVLQQARIKASSSAGGFEYKWNGQYTCYFNNWDAYNADNNGTQACNPAYWRWTGSNSPYDRICTWPWDQDQRNRFYVNWNAFVALANTYKNTSSTINTVAAQIATTEEFIDDVQGSTSTDKNFWYSTTFPYGADNELRDSGCYVADGYPYDLNTCVASWGGSLDTSAKAVEAAQKILEGVIINITNANNAAGC